MNTYTPQGGLSPQNIQLTAGQPNATNSAPPPGSPSGAYPSDQALNSAYASANANNVNLATPGYRQGMVQNSSIPGMEQNYDALAQQLFAYDQAKLAPQFQGQNPGTPADAASFGRVDASPLAMTVGSAGLPVSQGIYNANPKYAYQAQSTQANSLLDLLDTLNRGIGGNLDLTKGIYDNKTQAAEKALTAIYNIMQLKQNAVDKEASRASAGGLAGANQAAAEGRLLADAKKGVTFTDLLKTYHDELSASEIKDIYNKVNYYKKPAQESGDDINAIIAGGKPAGVLAKEKAAQLKAGQISLTKGTIQSLLSQFNELPGYDKNPLLGPLLAAHDRYSKAATYEEQRKALTTALKDVVGAGQGSGVRVNNYEIQNWMKLLPSPGDTPDQVKIKTASLDTQLKNKFGVGLDPEYGGTASDKVHITNGKQVLEFNQNDPEVQKALKNGWRKQ